MISRKLYIGERVRALRLAAGMSQAELGRRANLHREAVNAIERNRTAVGDDRLERLAGALGVTVESLVPQLFEPHAPLEDELRLEVLLGELGGSAEGRAAPLLAEGLGLLAHRVRLVEMRLNRADLEANEG